MGIFDRFRKKEDSVLPSEVDEYYKSELKNRRSSSVLMAGLALLATIVIASALFFGGRAVYRAINDDEGVKTGEVQEAPPAEQGAGENAPGSGSTTPEGQSPSESPTSPQAGDTPGSVPSTGDTALPRTGDEGL
jgi:hypothetical protein